jgi:hypothetical protein
MGDVLEMPATFAHANDVDAKSGRLPRFNIVRSD